MRPFLFVVALMAAAPLAAADDVATARAKAALALAKVKAVSTVVVAPAPRLAVLDYAEAKKLSLERGSPVVVFIGCKPMSIPDALTASVPTLENYVAGTVLICYPNAGSLWADAEMPCPRDPEELIRAVKQTAKKIVPPVKKGVKLNWD